MDVVCLEVLDRFEQLLEGDPESVEAGDTRMSPARAWSMSSLSPGRSNRLPEITSLKTRMAPALVQAVFVSGDVLVRGRHAGVAENVSLVARFTRPFDAG